MERRRETCFMLKIHKHYAPPYKLSRPGDLVSGSCARLGQCLDFLCVELLQKCGQDQNNLYSESVRL